MDRIHATAPDSKGAKGSTPKREIAFELILALMLLGVVFLFLGEFLEGYCGNPYIAGCTTLATSGRIGLLVFDGLGAIIFFFGAIFLAVEVMGGKKDRAEHYPLIVSLTVVGLAMLLGSVSLESYCGSASAYYKCPTLVKPNNLPLLILEGFGIVVFVLGIILLGEKIRTGGRARTAQSPKDKPVTVTPTQVTPSGMRMVFGLMFIALGLLVEFLGYAGSRPLVAARNLVLNGGSSSAINGFKYGFGGLNGNGTGTVNIDGQNFALLKGQSVTYGGSKVLLENVTGSSSSVLTKQFATLQVVPYAPLLYEALMVIGIPLAIWGLALAIIGLGSKRKYVSY